jgi:hypothetical protein
VNLERIIERMSVFPSALSCAVMGVSGEEARYKPAHPRYAAGAWSMLEIVNHLVDEEVEDFRTRVELTLTDPAQPWPKIDPEGVAVSRRYNERDMDDSIARFISERGRSIAWLRTLRNPDWDRAHTHPEFGPIRAGDLMASWPAHDALHLRQISKRLYELAVRDGAGYSVRYAGEWGA